MKIINELLKSQYKLVNIVVGLVGLLLVLLCNIPQLPLGLGNAFLSIGCSLIATCIATWISSVYILESNEKSKLLLKWKCNNIYQTKAIMNDTSNKYIFKAKKNIDVVATGMSNFINVMGTELEQKAKNGVAIRIISCGNLAMLTQRERDESLNYAPVLSCKMKAEVEALSIWVKEIKDQQGKIDIKYLNTYPGFSYLRIDDNIFFGPNLPLYKSQQNCAIEFGVRGKGGEYFLSYFEKLWNSDTDICSDHLAFEEDKKDE